MQSESGRSEWRQVKSRIKREEAVQATKDDIVRRGGLNYDLMAKDHHSGTQPEEAGTRLETGGTGSRDCGS